MDKREAIKLFIKRNPSIFNSDPFPNEVFKKLKRDFFVEFAKISPPKDSEIAIEVVEGLITSGKIKTEEELDTFFLRPFFKEKMANKTYFHEKLQLKTKHQEPILDVNRLEEAEYAQKVKEEFKKEAKEEVVSEKKEEITKLDEEIQKRKDELQDIHSILFTENYVLPDDEVKPDQISGYQPWWNKLGLIDDPFFPLEGLSNIDYKLREQVVCKTDIFLKYEQMIDRAPRELFKNTVVYGQFGSGKTTFFDYINPKLYDNKIYPIYIQLGGEFEIRELIFEFRRQMNTDLSRLYSVLTGQTSELLGSLDDESAIIELLKNLTDVGAKGFIVFVDDLHKGDLDKAMRFLSYLQVLTSQLLRRTSFVNIGFFIAGSLEWQKKMAHDDRYSGSVSREEVMPPLKMEIALDALNKRFKVFAKNPDNPRPFNQKFLEKIYKRLQYEQLDITFRRIIREVIKEFEAGHLEPLSIDPVKIPVQILEEIKTIFEKDLIIKGKFNRLIYSKALKPWQKRRCLELFVNTYNRNGLPDSEIVAVDAPFLQELARVGLIAIVSDEQDILWRISQEIWYLNKKIIQRYNLSFEDYLLKIFGGELPEVKRKIKSEGPEIELLNSIVLSMKEGIIRDLLNELGELHLAIIESEEKKEYLAEGADTVGIISKCEKSLAILTRAYQIFEKLPIGISANDLETLSFWKDFWWSPETVQQFIRATASEMEDKKRFAAHVISLYREAFPQLFCFFKEEYEKSRQLAIPLTYLKNNEISLLHECRDLWQQSQYEILADKLTKHLERKLRAFIWDVFSILYGDAEHRIIWIDSDSKKYITKNMKADQESGFAVSRNEFRQLNRAQYRSLMTGTNGRPEGRRNYNHIFHNVFTQWSERDLDDFLATFADFNIKVSHEKGAIDKVVQDYVYSFMQKSMRFMMDINRTYLKLLSKDCFKLCSHSYACFSLNDFKDEETLVLIDLSKEEAHRMNETIEGKAKLKVLLDDQEYVEGIFGLSYQKSYALLALSLNQTEEQIKKTKTRFSLVSSKGCEIWLRLEKVL